MRPCLVDSILPFGEIHIIAGASGVGKTTWGFQFLHDLAQGRPILGYPSHPVPFIYVSCDRSHESVVETLERLEIDPATIPYIDARTIPDDGTDSFDKLIVASRALVPGVRLIFVEAFSLMIPQKGSHLDFYRMTARYLASVAKRLARERLILIGTVHSPKQREDAKIIDPRQSILGTVAWGAFVETIIVIQRVNPMNTKDQNRQLYLLPRNAREQSYEYDLDERGRFVEIHPEIVCNSMDEAVDRWAAGFEIGYEKFQTQATRLGISRSTLDRWLHQKVDGGVLRRVAKGVYQKCSRQ